MSWLLDVTNKDEAYWVARVQQLISDNTKDTGDGHGFTDEKWLLQLFDEVVANLPPAGQVPYDGNMRLGATISAILALWYAQLHYAKTQDPHRPTYVRQLAYKKRLEWINSMILNMIDMSRGSTFFPGQPWQDPFDPNAKGGDFL